MSESSRVGSAGIASQPTITQPVSPDFNRTSKVDDLKKIKNRIQKVLDLKEGKPMT